MKMEFSMPYSRESVDELLDAASTWDISEIYCKLFEYLINFP